MKYLNNTSIGAMLFSGALLLTSCQSVQNANNTQKGTAIGAAAGAVIGGILGNNIGKGHHGAAGAILGGVVGGVAGNAIGKKMDRQAQEIQQALPGAQVERVGEGISLTLNENTVNFGFDSADLTPLAKSNLDKLAKVFIDNPDTNINIFGYTDSKGSDSYNLGLSERRANSVISYLVASGVARTRLTGKGMGEADPVATNDTDAGRALNRRVEFAISANQKMIDDAQQGQ